MRHRKAGRKLGTSSEHQRAIMRNLATSLITHGRIRTTEAKAKELRPYAERLITLAKKGGLHARRQASRRLFEKEALRKLFGEYAEMFKDRPGGYTRIIKEGERPGDNARMAYIEFMGYNPATQGFEQGSGESSAEEE